MVENPDPRSAWEPVVLIGEDEGRSCNPELPVTYRMIAQLIDE
jgi:hypothetical protein